jgi:uridine kinase
VLLEPLGPGGDRRFRPAIYDRDTDSALSPPLTMASPDAVLLFDGVFLMRPEVLTSWDLRIFVSTDFEVTVRRALVRERNALPPADIERRWRERYIPSQQLYFAASRPDDLADVIVHNDDPRRPTWESRVRRGRR